MYHINNVTTFPKQIPPKPAMFQTTVSKSLPKKEESCGKSQGSVNKKVTTSYVSQLLLFPQPICLVILSSTNSRTYTILPGSRVKAPVCSRNSQFLYSPNLTFQILRLTFSHREQMRGKSREVRWPGGERGYPVVHPGGFHQESLCARVQEME